MKDKRVVSLVAAMALLLTVAVPSALASHFGNPGPEVAPSIVTFSGAGSWSCPDGTKIEPVVDGTFAADFDGTAGTITIDVRQTAMGPVFDFWTDSGSHLVNSVLVKGGPDANLYIYPGDGREADDGLHSPLNPNNGKWYGLSHLCFETTKK